MTVDMDEDTMRLDDTLCDSEGSPRITVVNALVPASLTAAAYPWMKAMRLPSGLFWVDKDEIISQDRTRLDSYFPPALVDFILAYLPRLFQQVPPEDAERSTGFEIWWRVRSAAERRSADALHIDCDGQLQLQKKIVRTPLWGAILYVGPEAGLSGGETLFNIGPLTDTLFQHCGSIKSVSEWRSLFTDWIEVTPRQNRTVIFAGRIPHFANALADNPPGEPRVTFMANLWEHKLTAFRDQERSRVSAEEFHILQRVNNQELGALISLRAKLSAGELRTALDAISRLFGEDSIAGQADR